MFNEITSKVLVPKGDVLMISLSEFLSGIEKSTTNPPVRGAVELVNFRLDVFSRVTGSPSCREGIIAVLLKTFKMSLEPEFTF
jgi:hypothetical protein